MTLSINTNLASLTAQDNTEQVAERTCTSAITRLSSGLRINSANDDAAGLAISDRFTVADPRPQPGSPQRQRRHLAGADG